MAAPASRSILGVRSAAESKSEISRQTLCLDFVEFSMAWPSCQDAHHLGPHQGCPPDSACREATSHISMTCDVAARRALAGLVLFALVAAASPQHDKDNAGGGVCGAFLLCEGNDG